MSGRRILSSSWRQNLLSLTHELQEQAVRNGCRLCCLLLEEKITKLLCAPSGEMLTV